MVVRLRGREKEKKRRYKDKEKIKNVSYFKGKCLIKPIFTDHF
jgi:hypothetical protein